MAAKRTPSRPAILRLLRLEDRCVPALTNLGAAALQGRAGVEVGGILVSFSDSDGIWNSGMFFLTAGRMFEETRRHLPASL